METAQDFIKRYLIAKAENALDCRQDSKAFRSEHYAEDFLKQMDDWATARGRNQEAFESAEVTATSAKITTNRVSGKASHRSRYILAPDGKTWKITRLESE